MRGSKKNHPPATGLISLSGAKHKRTSDFQRVGPVPKKPRFESQDAVSVTSSELVGRVETLLASGNLTEAEALVVSVLSHIRSNYACTSSIGSVGGLALSRPAGLVSSRLPPAYTVGLLVIAKHASGPNLLARPSVLEQLYAILTLSSRDFGMSRLPASAMAHFAARSRGLHAFAANLLLIALGNQSKWPPKLVKMYLDDCLGDRIWVDLDECRAFILNIETALPPVLGDPRNLFAILCANGHPPPSLQAALGLNPPQGTVSTTPQSSAASYLDLNEAVGMVVHSLRTPQSAKVIHCGDPARLVSPRFDSCRSAVEGVILGTLREAFARRNSGSMGMGHTLPSSAVASGDSSVSSSSSGVASMPPTSTGEMAHLRCLIRTLAMAAGLPEVRSLAAQRLEPWLTNPKIQTLAVGLLTILVINCKQGSTSPSDIDTMVTVIFRIRQKLLKANIQAAVLENICRLAVASPNNLATLIKLCMASELPTIAAVCEANEQAAKQAAKQQQSQLPSTAPHTPTNLLSNSSPAAKCLAETIRKLCSQSAEIGGTSSHPDSTALNANTVAASAAEAVAKGHTSVSFILPRLYQRFPGEWIKVVSEVLHDRIIEAITNPNVTLPQLGGPLPAYPTDTQLVNHTVRLLAPMRQLLRDLAKWMRTPFTAITGPTAAIGNTGGGGCGDFLPCAELGCGLLLLDRSIHPAFAESATTVAEHLWQASGSDGRPSFGPFTVLRYIYAVVHVICQLQMLSVTRPSLCDAPAARKKVSGTSDPVKQHQACVRQLRLYFLRWFKSFVPNLISAAAVHFPASAPRDAFAQISLLLRRAFFLEVTAPFDISITGVAAFSPFYAAEELWPAEQNQRPFIYYLTYVNLLEKLAIHVLRHGLESQWGLVSPSDAAAIVCELIWRSTALSIDNGFESSNFTKLEELIDLLYACCSFCPDRELPSELMEMAHKDIYWKVSMALVALASHSPKTCGAHLWVNYPTVRKLMEMVITNDFTYPPLNAASDATSFETERLNKELEDQMILQLEAYLARPLPTAFTAPQQMLSSDEENKNDIDNEQKKGMKHEAMEEGSKEIPLPVITSSQSQLIGQLVRNNPRGACRYPPDTELTTLKRLCEQLGLRRRLCSCRQPDLLLELILSQAPDLPQPWVIQLVESMWQSIDVLPLQCLAEYLLHSSIQRIQTADEKAFTNGMTPEVPTTPVSRRIRNQSTSSTDTNFEVNVDIEKIVTEGPSTSRRVRLDSVPNSLYPTEKPSAPTVGTGHGDLNRRRLYNRVLERLRLQARSPPTDIASVTAGQLGSDSTPQHHLVDNIAEAVLQSFASRLRDLSSLIRRAARYCLTLLTVDGVTTAGVTQPTSGQLMQSTEELLNVLQSLVRLPGLSVAIDRQQQQQIESLETGTTTITTATATRGMDFLGLILNAILVEDDIAPLMAYIFFVGQLTEIASFVAWRPTMSCLSQLLLNRRTLVRRLIESSDIISIAAPNLPLPEKYPQSDMKEETGKIQQTAGFVVLENICRIMALDVDYYCTSASVIPVNEKNSVFVAWSPTRQCPMELEVIESHLVLLSWIPRRFIEAIGDTYWWAHLLNMWFICDSAGVYSLPSIVSLTSSTDPMHTKSSLVSLSASNKLVLSPELRSAFLVSGLPQLSSVALNEITPEELLQVVSDTPSLILDSDTANSLLDYADKLRVKPSTPKQIWLFVALQARAKPPNEPKCARPVLTVSRVFVRPNVVAPQDLVLTKSLCSPISPTTPGNAPTLSTTSPPTYVATETPGLSVPRQLSSDTREPPGGSKNLWRTFFSRLIEAGDDFLSQSEMFCFTLARVTNSSTVRNRWLQDLVNELQVAHGSLKRGRLVSLLPTSFVDILRNLPNLTAVGYAYSLIRSCLSSGLAYSDTKTISRYQKSVVFCMAELEKIAFHPTLLESFLLKPLQSLIAKRMEEQKIKSEENLPSAAFFLSYEQLESRSLEEQMEAITFCGFSSALPSAGDSLDTAWAMVQRLILVQGDSSDGDKKEEEKKKRRYLLEELVHNTAPTILRVCLRNILREDVRTLNSTLSLDLFSSVLNLPAFSSSVPFAEPHEKPDPGCLYSLLHRLEDQTEGMRLIAHVCIEASKVPSPLRDQTLASRLPLLDMALQCYLQPCLLYVEYLAGFLRLPFSLPPDLVTILADPSDIARRLLLCLYLRRPGLLYALKSSMARSLLRTPSASESIPECFEQNDVNRFGTAFLISLSSSYEATRETSALSSLALAIHHPRLCLRLLPLMAGLSQGRLDISLATANGSGGSSARSTLPWSKFVSRHHIDFYDGLLRFMEMLAFSRWHEKADGVLFSSEAEQYKDSIEEILASLIHAAASYPNHAAKMAGGFGRRLSRLLQAYTATARYTSIEDKFFSGSNSGSRRTRAEITRLAGALHDFAPFVAECSFPSPLSVLQSSFTSSSVTSKKHIGPATTLQPFVQRLRNPTSFAEVATIICDLDVLTERKVEFLVHFQSELEHLIITNTKRQEGYTTAAPAETSIQPRLLNLLFRLLRHSPQQAHEVLPRVFLPCLEGREATSALDHLAEACLLAPNLAPRFLHAAASRLVDTDGAPTPTAIVNAVGVALHRLSLVGVYEACIEHAASGLWTTATGFKFIPK